MEKLGIDPRLLITQIVNFTIMVFILTKLLYKPILKSLTDRQKKIEAELAAGESAKQELQKIQKRKEEILIEAREEAKVILKNAQKEGKRLKEDIVTEGRQEVATIKIKMERELKSKFDDLTSKVITQTIDLASEMIKKVLPEILTSEEQHGLIVKELKKIERNHADK